MATPRIPNGEMIAVHWLRTVTAKSELVSDVATTLPAIQRWERPTFVQAQLVAGRVDNYFPEHKPLIQVDVFSMKGKWNEVFTVAEMIRDASYYSVGFGEFTVREGFYPVNLGDVSTFSEPRPIRDDRTNLSRVIFDIQLTYVPIGEEYESQQGT